MKKYSSWLVLAVIIFAFIMMINQCSKPEAVETDYSPIDTSKDPLQINLNYPDTIFLDYKDEYVYLIKKANYDISAKVVSKEKYYRGWDGDLVPYDFALAWGNLVDKNLEDKIKYSQLRRFYYYKYNAESPYRVDYISTHSANNHLIPANKNIYRALRIVREGELVQIKGFLVRLQGKINEENVFWGTSLTRKDRGNRSCELIYVKEVKYRQKIYR